MKAPKLTPTEKSALAQFTEEFKLFREIPVSFKMYCRLRQMELIETKGTGRDVETRRRTQKEIIDRLQLRTLTK